MLHCADTGERKKKTKEELVLKICGTSEWRLRFYCRDPSESESTVCGTSKRYFYGCLELQDENVISIVVFVSLSHLISSHYLVFFPLSVLLFSITKSVMSCYFKISMQLF